MDCSKRIVGGHSNGEKLKGSDCFGAPMCYKGTFYKRRNGHFIGTCPLDRKRKNCAFEQKNIKFSLTMRTYGCNLSI